MFDLILLFDAQNIMKFIDQENIGMEIIFNVRCDSNNRVYYMLLTSVFSLNLDFLSRLIRICDCFSKINDFFFMYEVIFLS